LEQEGSVSLQEIYTIDPMLCIPALALALALKERRHWTVRKMPQVKDGAALYTCSFFVKYFQIIE